MSTWIKVARSHLADQKTYIVLPWLILAAGFLVIIALDGGAARHPLAQAYNLVVIYLEFFVVGILSIVRWLPFTLALGVSRRACYAGMTLLAVGLAAADVRAGLQALEPGRPADLHRRAGHRRVRRLAGPYPGPRLAGHRPLPHHHQRDRADRPAGRPRGDAGSRRLPHRHAAPHRLTRVSRS